MIKKLKKYMKEKNINQTQLAVVLGTDKFTISRWFSGRVEISKLWKEMINIKLGIDK